MAEKNTKKEIRILLLNTFVFFLGAYDAFTQDKITLFLILIVTALANSSMLLFTGNLKSGLNLFVFFLNAMIAFFVARDYYLDGSHYIHYAWIMAGMIYLIATVFIYSREKDKSSK
jgi:hypothetical protein